jgi:argininosuccinate lyase
VTLWGGRFGEGPDGAIWKFTVSFADRRLLEVDIEGSLAHVAGLEAARLLTTDEAGVLSRGLEQILGEARSDTFTWTVTDEDVHTAVERRLGELVGPVAGKLHTGRSRNDQVALDLRLWMRSAARSRISGIASVIRALADQAERAGETIVPSYTHLQQAQAVPLAHHLLAHAWALLRDARRFGDALLRIEVSPLGAGAGGGSRLPLDPAVAAAFLDLPAVFENSLDAVASRDAAAEYTFCCARTLIDLSRLAEELVLWSTIEFGWVTLADRHTTGSSALPHKKNPDPAELVRGKAGSAVGHLAGILAVEKGLPLSYNRDLQQDKEHLFAIDDDLAGALIAIAAVLGGANFCPPPPSPWVTALDLAEILVSRGVPFRDAHRAVGVLVAALEAAGRDLGGVTEDDLIASHPAFEGADVESADPVQSVRARRSPGGGSFASVDRQLAMLKEILRGLEVPV